MEKDFFHRGLRIDRFSPVVVPGASAEFVADVRNSDGTALVSCNDCCAQVYSAITPIGPFQSVTRRVVDLCTHTRRLSCGEIRWSFFT